MGDDERFASTMFMKVLVGDRGFNFEYASRSACSQHPRSTHLLTRAAGADLALLLPRRRPRTSTRALRSTRLPEPSRRFRRHLPTPRTACPRSSTNLALLTRRGIRASVAVSGARLTLLRLRPRRHNRRCRRASLAPRPPTRLRLGCERLWRCHLASTRPPRSGGCRAVVVFPLNGRPWDSDFHPYHDAMRLWWLLEFAQLLQNGRG